MKTQPFCKPIQSKNVYSVALIVFAVFLLFRQNRLSFSFRKTICYVQINQLITSAPYSSTANCAKNLILQTQGQLSSGIAYGLPYKDALEYLYKLAKESNYPSSIYLRIGDILWENGQKDAAIEAWQETEISALFITRRSIFEARNNNLESSLLWAEIAQQLDPTITETKSEMYSLLCDSLREDGRTEIALDWCARSSQVQHNGWRQIALANIYYDLGMFTEAVNLLQMELENPYSEQIKGILFHKLGQSYFRLGSFAHAENASRSAIRFGFREQEVYDNLTKSLIRQNAIREACHVLQTATENSVFINQDIEAVYSVDCKWENQ